MRYIESSFLLSIELIYLAYIKYFKDWRLHKGKNYYIFNNNGIPSNARFKNAIHFPSVCIHLFKWWQSARHFKKLFWNLSWRGFTKIVLSCAQQKILWNAKMEKKQLFSSCNILYLFQFLLGMKRRFIFCIY